MAHHFRGGARIKRQRGLYKHYNIDVSREDSQVYPEHVCLKCFAQMRRVEAARGTKYINPAVVVFNWQPHTDDCELCVHFAKCKKGGGQIRVGRIEGVLQARHQLKQ